MARRLNYTYIYPTGLVERGVSFPVQITRTKSGRIVAHAADCHFPGGQPACGLAPIKWRNVTRLLSPKQRAEARTAWENR